MIPKKFQEELSDLGVNIIREHALVYFSMEERTGKSLTALLVCEKIKVFNILIITKRKAYSGWIETLKAWEHEKAYTVTTYGSVHKLSPIYDLVILDEAHNYISGYPKHSPTWEKIKVFTTGLPLIYLSATPYAQTEALLYHQLALSSWSPFKGFNNFYQWFKVYGIRQYIKLHGRKINQYNNVKSELIHSKIDHLFISKTRKDLGFPFEPEDHLHYIELSESTKKLYNTLLKKKVIKYNEVRFLADSKLKLHSLLHMLEGGTLKTSSLHNRNIPEESWSILRVASEKLGPIRITHYYLDIENQEKIDYIKAKFGDHPSLVIMYNYKGEQVKLAKTFKQATILQATSFAEGVELSQYSDLVIYSQDYSTARHTQRRARQASMHRQEPIHVHFLLVKGGVSEQVYKTVAINKRNFVDKHFERTAL